MILILIITVYVMYKGGRYAQANYWIDRLPFQNDQKSIHVSNQRVAGLKFQDRSEYIGTFVLMYLSIGGGLAMMWMILGLNPTLILSVIAAPIWIFIVWVSNNLTKAIINDRKKRKR